MRKYLQHFVIVTVLLFAAASCKKDDAAATPKEASALLQTAISGVNGPTTGLVNQELTFNIIWPNADGTAKVDHVQDSTAVNTKFIRLFALTNVVDTAVLKPNELSTVAYKFKATTPGTYYLKFYKADNLEATAIIDTVNIK